MFYILLVGWWVKLVGFGVEGKKVVFIENIKLIMVLSNFWWFCIVCDWNLGISFIKLKIKIIILEKFFNLV